ncbi:hypothetical protein VSR34_12415 [Paraburkholderia sp. JHI2823]|uniref:hypothetical protein n=1 Tax=Paraburkholderia sp. JHI2823 TaxID=3112960 RepID=UPI003175FE44
MARPRTIFTDTELRGILAAAADADAHAPASEHNAAFLDRFIAGVARARTPVRPAGLRAAARYGGHPSSPLRAHVVRDAHACPVTPSSLAQLPPMASPPASQPESNGAAQDMTMFERARAPARSAGDERDAELTGLKVRAQVAEATLRDTYLKVGQLEAARADALQRVATAQAAARAAERRLQEVTAERGGDGRHIVSPD